MLESLNSKWQLPQSEICSLSEGAKTMNEYLDIFFYYWDEMCVSEEANVSDICWEFDVIQCQHYLNKRIFTIYAINFHDTHSKLAVVSQIFHYAFVWSMLIGTEKLLL